MGKLLTTLLTDHQVSSWKVTGEEQQAVVILRLNPVTLNSDSGTTQQSHHAVGSWSKKPPSKRRRDQLRNAKRKEQQQQQQRPNANYSTLSSITPTPSHAPPPPTETNTNGNKDSNSGKNNSKKKEAKNSENGHTTGQINSIDIDSEMIDDGDQETVCKQVVSEGQCDTRGEVATVTADSSLGACASDLQSVSPCVDKQCVEGGTSDTEGGKEGDEDGSDDSESEGEGEGEGDEKESEEDEGNRKLAERLASKVAISVDEVKLHLSYIKSKRQKQNLRDPTRNCSIQKKVMDRRRGRQTLICESDDLVIYYDFNSDMKGWFIKVDKEKGLYDMEKEMLCCLQNWPPLTDRSYDEFCETLTEKIIIASELVRLLMD